MFKVNNILIKKLLCFTIIINNKIISNKYVPQYNIVQLYSLVFTYKAANIKTTYQKESRKL